MQKSPAAQQGFFVCAFLTAAWCGASIVLFRLVNPSAAEQAWNAQASAQESRGISVRATSSRMVRREAEEHMA